MAAELSRVSADAGNQGARSSLDLTALFGFDLAPHVSSAKVFDRLRLAAHARSSAAMIDASCHLLTGRR